jgi:very-short-patch-repair endonuclease
MDIQLAAKSRLVKTFRFLKELNELRNPVPRDLSSHEVLRVGEWPVHPCVLVRWGDPVEEDGDEVGDVEIEPLIRIKRAPLTECPEPPRALEDWLMPGWQSVEGEVALLKSRNVHDEKRGTVTADFTEDPARVAALETWQLTRLKWVVAERPAIAARALFARVHALWTTMQRKGDTVELVLADGMLQVVDQRIEHPVLLQRLNLAFDPAGPEFRFSAGTESVELHRALLRLVPAVDGRMIAHFAEELERTPVEPLGDKSTEGFFRRLVQGLFTDGEFVDGNKVETSRASRPTIWRQPLIILRARTAGLSTTLDYIVEDLENQETQAPEGLARIVGLETGLLTPTNSGGDTTQPTPAGPEADILFSKPANDEQYQIAERLMKSKAVLVQGPPGTGKTHTIANLLGFLLAQGKTVLVTAHTTKALRVLGDEVDEALRPLCLSVLEGDADSQGHLSRAAQAIAARLSTSDASALRREAARLREERRKLRGIADSLTRQLRDARFSEVEEIVVGGEGLSPIDVARRVKSGAESQGWIPGPLPAGLLCPLTEQEIRQIYATQTILSPGDEGQLRVSQPSLADLLTPADFRLLASERAGTDARARAHRPELWMEGGPTGYQAVQLQHLHQRVREAAEVLAEEETWLREVLTAGWSGGGLREAWQDLLDIIETLVSEAGTAHRLIMAHGPELPAGPSIAETAAMLDDIVGFLEGGGAFGLRTKVTRRGWHQLVELCRVEGRLPRTLDEFRALKASAQLEQNRQRFAARWRRAVESLDGPTVETFGKSPERSAHGYAADIRKRLEWREAVWEPLIAELRAFGFRWESWFAEHPPVPGDHGELARVQRAGTHGLTQIVEAQAALLRQSELWGALERQRTYLAQFPLSDAAFVMLQAQETWNADSYEEAVREVARLEGLQDTYTTRQALLTKLNLAAPAWTRALSQRRKPHDAAQPPGDVTTAWRWRQWQQELDRRAAVSMTELQERLDRTQSELRRLAAQIIDKETWAAQRERTGLQAQQALMGFVQTLRKVGRGTGKRAPELLRHARELLASARSAVPVWIMPLTRVYESFDPRQTKFDVVIIDEASQSDVTALAALYFGREHVVVGDKEQVTPDAVGQRLDEVVRLISTELQGIPNSHLYDGQTSIYDLAEMAFGGVVALREHFRCVPDIIQFSNHLSYNNSIRPLREPLSAGVRPAVVAHRVNGFRRGDGKTNDVEAKEIASLVAACLSDPDYAVNDVGKPTSFGVISLLGEEQALLIENLLRGRISPGTMDKHRVLCGNAAQFQGDQRDVMFLSMVDGPPEDGQLPKRDAGPKDIFKKRFNVAVSRARNQLWVVYSLDSESHLKSGDLRQRLIAHARDPQILLRTIEEQGKRAESVFEKLVLERLVMAGYRVRPQWTVGAFRIDLVVEGESRRLAVECDGERWHTPEQLHADLQRQAILERLGWVFVRIRGSVFFRDPDSAMGPVLEKLRHLGVEPRGTRTETNAASSHGTVDRVKRHADAMRKEWSDQERAGEVQEVR